MGFDVTQPEPAPSEARSVAGLTPMTAVPAVAPVPAVVTEREELAERIAETAAPAKVEKTRKKARASAAAKGRKAAFTLRLDADRSEEHTSELQSLMRISYAVFCLKKK